MDAHPLSACPLWQHRGCVVRVDPQVSAGSTPFQGEAATSGPSRERMDGPAALTFAHVSAVHRSRCERGHPGYPEPDASGWAGADWSNAMCGEAGEAANVVKKLRRAEAGMRGVLDGDEAELRAKLADEIADVYLYLDLLATYYGVDVPAAIVSKFNRVSELQGFPERLS